MSLTTRQKRGLSWMLGIASLATLSTLAWLQIHAAVSHYFRLF